MAITDDRDVRDAIWYATDAISNRLQNNSIYIEKAKKSMKTLKDCCYNIDWDNARGLGEQKQYVWEDWDLKELRLNTKIPTREEIEKKIERWNTQDIFTDSFIFHYKYTCEDGYKIETQCCIPTQAFCMPTHLEDEDRVRKQRAAVNELIDKVLKHYNKKYSKEEYCMIGTDTKKKALKCYNDKHSKEEYGMTGMQFENFNTALRAMGGSFGIELDGMNEIAHIEIPAGYLKYFDIKMPTTDFCTKKLNTEWIEGLPAIKKIETYNDRVTKVTFIDDTFTKAVCSENDHFDEDVGITICCMKRLFGKDGNRMYNDMIRYAHKVIDDNAKKKEAEAKEKAERKLKAKKAAGKKAVKKLKAKQEQIDIQTQAIIQAHDALEARNSEA